MSAKREPRERWQMPKQKPDSKLKEQDYTQWVETQSTEALEKELSTLELGRIVLQNTAPEMEASMEQTGEDWAEEWAKNYNAEMAAATTLEEKKKIQERYEGPRYDEITESRLAQEAAELLAKPASLEAGIDPAESEIPPWLAERVQVNLRIRIVERELNIRRNRELSKREVASALARAQKLRTPPAGQLMPSYRSKLKQAIWMQLAENSQASNSQIVRGLDDEDEPVKLPATWRSGGNVFSFWTAFTGIHKDKVEKEISKVRSDLRKRRLLPPR